MQDDTGNNDAAGRKEDAGRPDVLSEVQDFFNEFVSGFRGFPVPGTQSPRYDMARTDAEYTILVDLPGVPKEALEVNAVGDGLTISGDRPRPDLPEGAEVLRTEREVGRFSRTVRLPGDVDVTAVRAKLDSGVLRVTLPRRGREGEKKIEIEVESEAPATD